MLRTRGLIARARTAIAGPVHAWRARGIPVVDVDTSHPVRVAIGPANSAGQAYQWARVTRSLPGAAAVSFSHTRPGGFAFPVDVAMDHRLSRTNAVWRERQREALLGRFTHVLAESGRPLWGNAASVQEQLEELRSRRVRVGLVFHGSDIRIPHVHALLEPDSPFIEGRYADTEKLEKTTAANHALVRASGCPVFVATPQLLDFLPDATWLPVVVDPEPWEESAATPALERDRPVVVHAPSSRGLKGSELIAPALTALDRDGVITYREVKGVPSSQMPSVYGDADIVLDQFVNGGYGVAACEAMAAGRLVLAHVAGRHRAVAAEAAGIDLPVVEARVGDVVEVLRRIVKERDAYREVAARGPAFVRRLHDGTHTARVLSGFLGLETPPPLDNSDREGRNW